MQFSYLSPTTALLFLAVTTTCSAAQPSSSAPPPLTIHIDHADGGKIGKRHSHNLLASLETEGCRATLSDPSSDTRPQLLFGSRPIAIAKKDRPDYRLIAIAKNSGGRHSSQRCNIAQCLQWDLARW